MKAWQLIDDESSWTTGAPARNRFKLPVGSSSPDAVRWCAQGAISRCYQLPEAEVAAGKAVRRLCRERYGTDSISRVNDKQGHAAILAILKEADV